MWINCVRQVKINSKFYDWAPWMIGFEHINNSVQHFKHKQFWLERLGKHFQLNYLLT